MIELRIVRQHGRIRDDGVFDGTYDVVAGKWVYTIAESELGMFTVLAKLGLL